MQREEHFQPHSMRPQSPLHQNQKKILQKKENCGQTNITDKHSQQNTIKLNPTIHYDIHYGSYTIIKGGLSQGFKKSSIYVN